jgi:glycosyltransferase involved in cell wall biosynthesis
VVTPFGTSSVTGGAEKWLLGMITSLPEVRWRVLLLQDGPFRDELRAAGVPVAVARTGRSAVAVAAAASRTSRAMKAWRPDVVVGNGVKAQLVVALSAALGGRSTVWVKHDYSFDRTLARPLGLLSDRVVTTAVEVGSAARRPDLVVINPPVQEREPSDRETARRRLREHGLSFDDRPSLVMAGRLVPYKGVDDAVAALGMAGAEEWRLIVVGDDDHSAPGEQERLSRLARRRGVAERVTFVPPVRGLGDLFAAFDALAVLTKPTDRRSPSKEGFGMTAFEAMQAGIPVVAVAGSPVSGRLGGAAGIPVGPGAPEEIAAALGRMSDPAVRLEMGRQGRRIASGYADVETAAAAFAAVLRGAAARSRGSVLRAMVRRALPGADRTSRRGTGG